MTVLLDHSSGMTLVQERLPGKGGRRGQLADVVSTHQARREALVTAVIKTKEEKTMTKHTGHIPAVAAVLNDPFLNRGASSC